MKKVFVRILSTIVPGKITNLAYRVLTTPRIRPLRLSEIEILDKAEKEDYQFQKFNIKIYKWKGGSDKVLLIHGWEGQAGNFSELVESLIEQGYGVYAFDAPSHGLSSKGDTSLFNFSELVAILIRKLKVTKLISHSFGSVATTYALFNNRDLCIDKYVLLTTPDKFQEHIEDISKQVGLSEGVKNRLIKRVEFESALDTKKLNVSDFVKVIHVSRALIIHDKNDRVIPISRSRNVYDNWSVCEFVEIVDTGHFKILSSKSVIENVLNFLKT